MNLKQKVVLWIMGLAIAARAFWPAYYYKTRADEIFYKLPASISFKEAMERGWVRIDLYTTLLHILAIFVIGIVLILTLQKPKV